MEVLPQDIIVNILSRLPPKSVGRSRCVSKPWKSILSQPHFIKTHRDRTKLLPTAQESLLLASKDSGSFYSVNFDNNAHHNFEQVTVFASQHNINDLHFIASCDGLILMNETVNKWFLVNPTTNSIKELPISPFAIYSTTITSGVGYDSINDDYKVVSISCGETVKEHDFCVSNEAFVNVYSVKNGTWKNVESSPYDHSVGYNCESGVLLNGYIHWLVGRFSGNSYVIAAFDLGEERFWELPLPSSIDNVLYGLDLVVVLKGCLCFIPFALLFFGFENATDVWMMKEYGVEKSWTKIRILSPDTSFLRRPLYMVGEEQLVTIKNEDTNTERLVMYNLEEGTSKDIVVHGIPHSFRAVGIFMESLVSPHCS